jgi:flavin reductase (DIM6/NTAB) family NADH-FMN oxidoreductase RutF
MHLHADAGGLTDAQHRASLELFQSDIAPALRRDIPDPRRGDRFGSLRWWATAAGAVLLEGASAWLDCGIEREILVGDHDLILLRVHALDADPDVPPLIFYGSRYRRLGA